MTSSEREANPGGTGGEPSSPASSTDQGIEAEPRSRDKIPKWLTAAVAVVMVAVVGMLALLVWSVFTQDQTPVTAAERDVVYYRDIVDRDPQNYGARTRLALALLDTGQTERALAEVDRALELESRNLEGYLVRSEILRSLGRVDEAVSALEQATTLLPGAFEPSYRLAELYLAEGRLEDAAATLDALLEQAPTAADALVLRGQVYQELGDSGSAQTMYERALEYVPGMPAALEGLAGLGVEASE